MSEVKSAIKFTLDGKEVEAREGETIWQVAARLGISIPHLCWSTAPSYRADGNCRACMVEIEGERALSASCLRKPTEGMKVGVSTARALSDYTFIPTVGVRLQDAASTRSPSISTMQARQLPSGR